MLTLRSLSLTTAGLLLGLTAAAQTTSAAANPANADMLSWILGALLGAAGIVAVLASITLGTVANIRRSEPQTTAAPVRPLIPLGMSLPQAAQVAPAPASQPVAPAPRKVAAPTFATAPAMVEEGVAAW